MSTDLEQLWCMSVAARTLRACQRQATDLLAYRGQRAQARACSCTADGQQASAAAQITSVQNSYIKHCVKLRTSSKYRRQCGSTLLCGLDVIEEQLELGDYSQVRCHIAICRIWRRIACAGLVLPVLLPRILI